MDCSKVALFSKRGTNISLYLLTFDSYSLLEFTGSESDDMFAPVFLKKLENQTVEEQETVTMECDVIGSQPIVTWYFDGKTLPVGDKFRVSYDGKTARLTLKGVAKGDNGKYECSAENSAGRITCDCVLLVKGLCNSSIVFL